MIVYRDFAWAAWAGAGFITVKAITSEAKIEKWLILPFDGNDIRD